MEKTTSINTTKKNSRSRPALTPEARENQLVALAINLAEQQLRDGTASSQVITHYLKLGSSKEKLERERLERENELLKAKTEALSSTKRMEDLYIKAMEAFTDYKGMPGDGEDEEDYEY